MPEFVAACFNLYVDPARQQTLRERLPITLWDLHADICECSEYSSVVIVDFVEIRLPITGAADCDMEKEVDVLKIILLHLRGSFADGSGVHMPRPLMFSKDKKLRGFAMSTIVASRLPSTSPTTNVFGSLDRECFHRWFSLPTLKYRMAFFDLCGLAADDHNQRIVAHSSQCKTSRNSLQYVRIGISHIGAFL